MNGGEDGGMILHLGCGSKAKQAEAIIGPLFGQSMELNMEDVSFSKQILRVSSNLQSVDFVLIWLHMWIFGWISCLNDVKS